MVFSQTLFKYGKNFEIFDATIVFLRPSIDWQKYFDAKMFLTLKILKNRGVVIFMQRTVVV